MKKERRRKLTLKVRNQDFSIATCQMYVDVPKKIIWKSVIFYSIKLPFVAEVAEKILNGIYYRICDFEST